MTPEDRIKELEEALGISEARFNKLVECDKLLETERDVWKSFATRCWHVARAWQDEAMRLAGKKSRREDVDVRVCPRCGRETWRGGAIYSPDDCANMPCPLPPEDYDYTDDPSFDHDEGDH